jgi:hypothetical protein
MWVGIIITAMYRQVKTLTNTTTYKIKKGSIVFANLFGSK